jgi:hypothetical protein
VGRRRAPTGPRLPLAFPDSVASIVAAPPLPGSRSGERSASSTWIHTSATPVVHENHRPSTSESSNASCGSTHAANLSLDNSKSQGQRCPRCTSDGWKRLRTVSMPSIPRQRMRSRRSACLCLRPVTPHGVLGSVPRCRPSGFHEGAAPGFTE